MPRINRRLLPTHSGDPSRVPACEACLVSPWFKCCGVDSTLDTAEYCVVHMRDHWDYAHKVTTTHMGKWITQATADRISQDGP